MQRILLNCESADDAQSIKTYLEAETPYQVLVAMGSAEAEICLRQKTIHLMLLQTGRPVQQDIESILLLRRHGFNYPSLIITDRIGDVKAEEASEKHKIYLLERPFELNTLKGLTRKLMATREVSQQVFRRYKTNLITTVEDFISGESYTTQMFNLSRGGAYFEVAERPEVGVGDLLRIKVCLQDVNREHHIHGRIVWMTHRGHASGGYGLGVKFMRSNDIYRSLLDQV